MDTNNDKKLQELTVNELKARRIELKKTLAQLQIDSGVPKDTINKIENGKRKASLHTLKKICDALGLDWKLYLHLSTESTLPNLEAA